MRELRGLTETQKNEIAIAIEAGAKTEQLTNKYGLSAGALELLASKTDAAAEASKRLTAEKEREAAALEKAYAKLMSDIEERQPARDHGGGRGEADRGRDPEETRGRRGLDGPGHRDRQSDHATPPPPRRPTRPNRTRSPRRMTPSGRVSSRPARPISRPATPRHRAPRKRSRGTRPSRNRCRSPPTGSAAISN